MSTDQTTKTRILFVDDEINVLDGLRAALRRFRKEWQMEFVLGGEEALRVLAHQEFDVVISDMRMPTVDGVGVLSYVKSRHPSTVRIVLSGFTEQEAAMRLVPIAHQFLAKPCDSNELHEIIVRSCALQNRLRGQELRVATAQLSQLPSPPEVYIKLVECTADPKGTIRSIVQIVEADSAISAKILQVANSPFFGSRTPITSVQKAVMLLGSTSVRDLALAFQAISMTHGKIDPERLSLADEQAHALAVGQIARRIAKDIAPSFTDDAMVAGLLHDIGYVVLALNRPEQWRLYRDSLDSGLPHDLEREEAMFGMNHCEIGGYLLSLWGLPYTIVEAVSFHHAPSQIGASRSMSLAGIVHLADNLVSELSDSAGKRCGDDLDREFVEAHRLEKQIETWRSHLRERLTEHVA